MTPGFPCLGCPHVSLLSSGLDATRASAPPTSASAACSESGLPLRPVPALSLLRPGAPSLLLLENVREEPEIELLSCGNLLKDGDRPLTRAAGRV